MTDLQGGHIARFPLYLASLQIHTCSNTTVAVQAFLFKIEDLAGLSRICGWHQEVVPVHAIQAGQPQLQYYHQLCFRKALAGALQVRLSQVSTIETRTTHVPDMSMMRGAWIPENGAKRYRSSTVTSRLGRSRRRVPILRPLKSCTVRYCRQNEGAKSKDGGKINSYMIRWVEHAYQSSDAHVSS